MTAINRKWGTVSEAATWLDEFDVWFNKLPSASYFFNNTNVPFFRIGTCLSWKIIRGTVNHGKQCWEELAFDFKYFTVYFNLILALLLGFTWNLDSDFIKKENFYLFIFLWKLSHSAGLARHNELGHISWPQSFPFEPFFLRDRQTHKHFLLYILRFVFL